MSITFSLACRADDGALDSTCPDGENHRRCIEPDPDHAADWEMYQCCDCVDAAMAACWFCSIAVNMANNNAAQVIARLGIEFDHCGVIDPRDLMGRALTADIGMDDSGVPALEEGGPGTGRAHHIECGIPAGYFADRFGALADLATVAIERDMVITWG